MLNVVVMGPQRAPPRSVAEGPRSGLDVPKAGDLQPVGDGLLDVTANMGMGAPEDDAYAMREELLQGFHEEFLVGLKNGDEASHSGIGHARKEARAVFHRRFLSTLDLAMSKHDSTVMTAPSTFGNRPAQQPGGSCMACDRPLRMRYRSRPLVYLHSQEALLDGAAAQMSKGAKQQRAFSKMQTGTSSSSNLAGTGGDISGIVPESPGPRSRPGSAAPTKSVGGSGTKDFHGAAGNANTYGRGSGERQRPASAGATRYRTAVKTAAIGDGKYVMRSGFKMPVLREEELLAAKLARRFPKDASMGMTTQIYPPPLDLANMDDDSGHKPNNYTNNFDQSFKRPAGEVFDFGDPNDTGAFPAPIQDSVELSPFPARGAQKGVARLPLAVSQSMPAFAPSTHE